MLLFIKQKKYYNKITNSWHIGDVIQVLKLQPHYTSEKKTYIENKYPENLWGSWKQQANKLWFWYSREERKHIYEDLLNCKLECLDDI